MDTFEKTIDYKFNNKNLLEIALTHRSYVNENSGVDNERLEFLGDAVLQLLVTTFLYSKYDTFSEGMLSAYRSALVEEKILAKVADEICISKYMKFSKARETILSEGKDTVTSDAVEALIGAMYLDGGIECVKKFVDKFINSKVSVIESEKLWIDPKTYFQNTSQEKLQLTPYYKIVEERGGENNREFVSAVYLGEEKIAEGIGNSKKKAEKNAAENAIDKKGW